MSFLESLQKGHIFNLLTYLEKIREQLSKMDKVQRDPCNVKTYLSYLLCVAVIKTEKLPPAVISITTKFLVFKEKLDSQREERKQNKQKNKDPFSNLHFPFSILHSPFSTLRSQLQMQIH